MSEDTSNTRDSIAIDRPDGFLGWMRASPEQRAEWQRLENERKFAIELDQHDHPVQAALAAAREGRQLREAEDVNAAQVALFARCFASIRAELVGVIKQAFREVLEEQRAATNSEPAPTSATSAPKRAEKAAG